MGASSEKLSTTVKSLPFSRRNGTKHNLLRKKTTHSYEKIQTIESFREPIMSVKRNDYSSLTKPTPDDEQKTRTVCDTIYDQKQGNLTEKDLEQPLLTQKKTNFALCKFSNRSSINKQKDSKLLKRMVAAVKV